MLGEGMPPAGLAMDVVAMAVVGGLWVSSDSYIVLAAQRKAACMLRAADVGRTASWEGRRQTRGKHLGG